MLIRLLAAGVWGLIAVLGVLAWYAYDLPNIDDALAATRRPTITLLAADGGHLLTVGDIHGLPVDLDQVPAAMVQAVLATEDRRFYDHFGLDIIGLARATWVNLRAGGIVQGGSTLTQQVAKNLFLTPERTLGRKIRELLLALWLERRFNKDQILTIYLNRVYLGSGAYGIEAASRRYFSRPASAINTYQAAMLAGLLKAPSRYNPVANPKLAKKRTAQVLSNMVAAGYLTTAEARQAEKTGSVKPSRSARRPRYFSDWVLARISSYVSPGDTDITVTTTLDRALQADAEAAVARALEKGGKRNVKQAALLAMSPGGAVRAMVGGADYGLSQFNRATQALRQPGSAFKPMVYLAGLEAGLKPDDMFDDAPLEIDGWSPRNFSRKYQGKVSMSEALANSINTVAVRIAETAGRQRVVDTARRLGVTSTLAPTPSLALGSSSVTLIELTSAYGAFANGGYGVWAHGIKEIRDAERNILYRRQGSGPGRVMSGGDAAAINKMLAATLRDGTGKAAALRRPAAGKTGTSQNFRDAWFVGYSADLVAGVWMGNDDSAPMNGVTGGGLPARMWRDFMVAAHGQTQARAFPKPGRNDEMPDAGLRPKGDFWDKLKGLFR